MAIATEPQTLYAEEKLSPLPANAVQSLELSAETTDFLISTGLPINDQTIRDRLYTHFYSDLQRSPRFSIAGQQYVAIAENKPVQICLAARSGEVYAIDKARNKKQFVNSSVQNFLSFTQIYLDAWDVFENGDDAQGTKAVKELKREMRQLDPKALSRGAWWDEVVADKELMFCDFELKEEEMRAA